MLTRRAHRWPVAALLFSLALSACSSAASPADPEGPVVRVGSWPGIESRVLAGLAAGLLTQAGVAAEVVELADAATARQALELNDVELMMDYTGAAWLEVLGRSDPPGDPRSSFARVREYDEARGRRWLRPAFSDEPSVHRPPVNATFALLVRGVPFLDATMRTISDLARRLSEEPDRRICLDEDFANRSDGREALFRAYGISLERQDLAASPEEAVLAVQNGECIAGLGTVTDGAAHRAGLVPLVDDLEVFPAFVVVPVLDESLAAEVPGALAALAIFGLHATGDMLASWNARVLSGEPVESVVAEAVSLLRRHAGADAESAPRDR